MARKAKGRKAAKGKGRKRSRQGTEATGGSSKWAKFNTNSLERRMGTRKEGRCQLCLTKADLDDQYTVVNDLDAGTVKKAKNASAEKNEHLSHYCGDCADKRVARKEYWMENVREASGPDQRGKSGGSKKKTAKKKRVRKGKGTKGKGKGKKAAAKGKAPRKRTRKTRAKSDAKPKRQRRTAKAKAAEADGDDEPF